MVKPSRTHIVILGSGSPIANPERSGPALAIIVENGISGRTAAAPVAKKILDVFLEE